MLAVMPETSPPASAHSPLAWASASARRPSVSASSGPTGASGRLAAVSAWPVALGDGVGVGLVVGVGVTLVPPPPVTVPVPPLSRGHEMEAAVPFCPPTVVQELEESALARASRASCSRRLASAWALRTASAWRACSCRARSRRRSTCWVRVELR